MEEVKAALFNMMPTKAPGPDGFPPAFFQQNWETVKHDIFQALIYLVERNYIDP